MFIHISASFLILMVYKNKGEKNMDFTLTPEPVYFAEDALNVSREQPVDLDFTLPDYCADVEKIFKCTVTPEVYSTNSGGGQLTVEGASLIRVLYCSVDKKTLKCAEQTLPFSASFNLSSDSSDLITSVKAKTEYVNCKAVSPRRLMIHGCITLNVKVSEKKSSNLYLPPECKELQTDLRKTKVSELMSLQSEVFAVAESISVNSKHPVCTVIRSEVKTVLNDVSAVGNRMLLKGELTLCMLYCTEHTSELPEQFTYVCPFVHNMECPDAQDSMIREIDLNLMSHDIKLKTDITGDNPLVVLEAKLCASVACRKETEVTYISDAYSTACETELEYAPVTLETSVLPKVTTLMNKSSVDLGENKISRVIDIFCDNVSIKPYVSDKLKLSGKANFCILALDENSELTYIERSVEIDNTESLNDTFTSCDNVTSMIKSVSYRIADNNNMELRVELLILTKLIKTENIQAVMSVSDCGEPENADSCALTLYFADEGESVWNIAKRYRTDKMALCIENNLSEKDLTDKMLLLIPKV